MTQKWIIFSKRNETMWTKFEKVNDFHIILGISENPNPTWVPGFFEIKTQNPLFQNPTPGLKTLLLTEADWNWMSSKVEDPCNYSINHLNDLTIHHNHFCHFVRGWWTPDAILPLFCIWWSPPDKMAERIATGYYILVCVVNIEEHRP